MAAKTEAADEIRDNRYNAGVQQVRKINTVFEYTDDYQMAREPRAENAWVLEGEGIATVKYDGEAVRICDRGWLWRRRTLRAGQYGDGPDGLPDNWVSAQPEPRPNGKWPGWELCSPQNPAHQWHYEAFRRQAPICRRHGTYELCGPKLQGNPHGFDRHVLVPHGGHILPSVPRDWSGLRDYLAGLPYEGIVFHHPDGRMAKIRRTDFGHPWPLED